MPLFGKKKQKSPKRRLEAGSSQLSKSNLSLGEAADYTDSSNTTVKLKLGNYTLAFQDGEWIEELKDSGASSESRLKKQNLQLKEENNFLKYKVEVLLDMLAVTTADCNVLEKEIEALEKHKDGRSMAR